MFQKISHVATALHALDLTCYEQLYITAAYVRRLLQSKAYDEYLIMVNYIHLAPALAL